ncbi:MBL fold metallo-hydrolase [Mesorhizobium sp. M0676]|uniref:MBL fold metallo-hydrolase n=1 Tax=unclassified Mesorhizobium TaxID=325217 RepID=UPI003339B41D
MSNYHSGSTKRIGAKVGTVAVAVALGLAPVAGACADNEAQPGQPGIPYLKMPSLAPIGERVDHYLPIPKEDVVPPHDPGYRIQELGRDLYMITDNGYQSMFLVYESGVVVVDAPPGYSGHIREAIAEVTDRPITHVVYSHAHADHIAGVNDLGGHPIIIAQEETQDLLGRANDPRRPLPTVTFKERYTLKVGSQVLELSYPGSSPHEPGNIFIYAPKQKVLMVVDIIFPGWMPWRRFALAKDVPGYFQQVADIDKMPFETIVGGHVNRVGTHADVRVQLDFMNDLKTAATAALKSTAPAEEMSAEDKSNPWAIYDNYIDRVVVKCVNDVTPKWQSKLAGYDVFIWDQCYAMEQSLRID